LASEEENCSVSVVLKRSGASWPPNMRKPMSGLDKPTFDSEVSKKDEKKRKEEKECEHSAAMCSHQKRINTRGTGQHTRHHHHEHLEMGKWKEYAFQILSGSHMHLFPTSAIHIRLASKSQQDGRNCATRLLVSHGLMRSTPISAHYDLA
jgi:hypothetical protein